MAKRVEQDVADFDSRQRLTDAVKRRDELIRNVERVQGRLDVARQELASVEAECRQKKVDPDKIGEVIRKLQERYETSVAGLEDRIRQGETALAPFLREST
ncbi:hypothetical protein [Candidatus Magnetobacterium casense]|uniref:Uncharacterized protein n=1 Tax=Candidatus Magnetobacterium casense TaxID=1455061 RepID=A0ABS6S3L3_9BACT|nr:hypothetical protein [Candidatus Magnetobacterium casensis]MBV6342953.1 hypothetical protein [Candidatus Magnetobacterium casensis]